MLNVLYAISGGLWAVVPIMCLAGWSIAILRKIRHAPIVAYTERRPVPWGLLDLVLILVISVGIQVFAAIVVGAMWGEAVDSELLQNDPQLRAFWMSILSLSTLVTCLLAIALVRQRVSATVRDLGIDFAATGHDVTIGVFAFAMLIVPVFAVQFVLTRLVESHHPLIDLLRDHPDPWFFVIGGVAAVLIAPVVEEYFFRVFLQGWLENLASLSRSVRGGTTYPVGYVKSVVLGLDIVAGQRQTGDDADAPTVPDDAGELEAAESPIPESPLVDPGFSAAECLYFPPDPAASKPLESADSSQYEMRPAVWPILVASLFFALAHFQHGPDPIPLFLLALGLGYLYQRTHRVLPCIVVHCLVNGISLFQLWLLVQTPTG